MATTTANNSPATPAPAPTRTGRNPRRRQIKWIVAAVVLIAAVLFAARYWIEQSRFVETDDAYVQANQVDIAAQVAGPVTQVFVRNQQAVKAGDVLFTIDPRNYEIAVQKARAQLELARQGMSQESAGVASAEAVLTQRRAEAANARGVWERNQQLMKSGFLSPQGAENSRTQLATAEAAVKAAQAQVAQARSALGHVGEENAAVQAAAAALRQAQLDLERTQVKAPASGLIANFTLQPGNMVQPGAPLFVVIANDEYWVEANFKETQLKDIRPGQHAEIRADMYPDHVFHGVVESLSGGSGAAFSLLPPQNATGNWVKVTQRVPVRVRVEDPDPAHPLRIGTTTTVKVSKAAG
ncbi:MAG TPA: HlyD family secretion protein [Usitatibacter sp.]|nr:HlyD family secretion protein [Usitatibacter sp.]